MKKNVQSLIGFILLLICISAIVYSFNIRKEENRRKSYKEVNSIIQEENQVENTDIYTEFLKNYNSQGEEYYYSFIELDGYIYPILLLSDLVYKDNERNVALCTDVYYPVNKEVTLFGTICSDGTAYPLASDASGIYTAGGHHVAKYYLDIQSQKLKLINKHIMFFHKIAEKVNAITIKIIGDENKIVSEEEFNKAYKEYANAKTIYYKRLLNNK
ncbi:MAG: hypothetical protein ACYDEX_06600 [Mobilitalea sp.]